LKLFFLAIGLCTFSGVKAQWSTYGEYVMTNWNNLLLNSDATDLNSSEILFKNPNGPWSIMTNKFHFSIVNDRIPSNEITTPFTINKTTSNVCIGCDINAAPTHKLHVDGMARAADAIIGNIGNNAIFGNHNALIGTGGYALLQGPLGGTALNCKKGATISLKVNDVEQAIVSDTKVSFLDNVGIGIGMDTPTHKLQVGGMVRATDAVMGNINNYAIFGNVNALNNTGGADNNYALLQGPLGATSLNCGKDTSVNLNVNNIPQVSVSEGMTKILSNLTVEGGGVFGAYNHIKGTTSFGAERIPLFSGATVAIDGRLLISDTNAAHNTFTAIANENYKDYLLWVQEGIVATDFAVAALSQWPDYVFNKEYKLNTLNEVATFIKTNGHLPTMPSAKEIEEKGFTLSDMTKRTVKTVEELTLHTIEQQKLIENQAQLIENQAQSIENQAQLIESLAKRLNALEAKQ
jgi:hypothetical protein